MKNKRKCYRCNKKANFFFESAKRFDTTENRYFYNDVSYWDESDSSSSGYYKFLCSRCVMIEMVLSRFRGESIVLMKRSNYKKENDCYNDYNGSLKTWISESEVYEITSNKYKE